MDSRNTHRAWLRISGVIPLVLAMGLGGAERATAQSNTQQTQEQTAAQKEFQQKLDALHWVTGPKDLSALGNATLSLPNGFVFLDNDDTKSFMVLNQNPPDSEAEQLFAPRDLHWFAIIGYSADGYVRDDEKIDADAILETIKLNTEDANAERRKNGWGELHIVGWKKPPYYDQQTKRLEWAFETRDDKNEENINFLTKILGRHGVTTALLVADPNTFDADLAQFKQTLTGYDFNTGEKYSEYQPGDKVATYGLAALIAGGAAAVATKLGFWKWIGLALAATWKFIWVPIVAAGAAVKRLFRRKQSS